MRRAANARIRRTTHARTVGTAALMVTRCVSMSACSDAPSKRGPGRTSWLPASSAAERMLQPFAWKLGTHISMRVSDDSAIKSGMHAIRECNVCERCE